ncbi:helix-turn-helix domain-containing protein [Solibacillus sp. MA9]|uniref:Helix-turn-helix domain-containing protein n=1 Tax=Solibacillus palustris TaxID=2908203 RepID=A0ABS9UEH3_9BACL|nr:helix-turn-helix domain-containing protein [Solibacillus sp. MA9]MCH7322716.1 helix-turn-helix domain-containing protein [Solibacillus sp. MA9]
MVIIVNPDVLLAKRKMSVTELSEHLCITIANVSILKNDKAKTVKFSTLEKKIKNKWRKIYNEKISNCFYTDSNRGYLFYCEHCNWK